jgi:serine/threonine protein phosphatase PrpC
LLKAFFQTDQGRVRSNNEDNGAVIHLTATDVFTVLADGMGGHRSGDVASKMAVDFLTNHFHTYIQENPEVKDALQRLLEDANNEIFTYSNENPECQGMGTTVIAIRVDQDQFVIAHVGDSRCYHIKGDTIEQITEDHTLVNELVKSGQITREEAEIHPRKNVIMRSVGTDPTIEVDLAEHGWSEGDYLLLCSDGLSDKVKSAKMLDVINGKGSLEDKTTELIQAANEAGGEDNITIILVHNAPTEEVGEHS